MANSRKKSHGLQLMCSGQFPIEPAAPSVHFRRDFVPWPFGRRPRQRVNSLVMPATENLHNLRHQPTPNRLGVDTCCVIQIFRLEPLGEGGIGCDSTY